MEDRSRTWKQDLHTLTKDFSPLFLLSPQALEGVKRILGKRTWDMARLQLSWLLRMCNTTEMDVPQFLCFGSRRAMTAHLRQYNYTIPREVTLTDLKEMMMTWFRIQIRQKLITLAPLQQFASAPIKDTDNLFDQSMTGASSIDTDDLFDQWVRHVRNGNVCNQLEEILLILCAHVMLGRTQYEAVVRATSWCHAKVEVRTAAERFIYHLVHQSPDQISDVVTRLQRVCDEANNRTIPREWYQQYLTTCVCDTSNVQALANGEFSFNDDEGCTSNVGPDGADSPLTLHDDNEAYTPNVEPSNSDPDGADSLLIHQDDIKACVPNVVPHGVESPTVQQVNTNGSTSNPGTDGADSPPIPQDETKVSHICFDREGMGVSWNCWYIY